jgi:hypothetical protein
MGVVVPVAEHDVLFHDRLLLREESVQLLAPVDELDL